MVTTPWWDRSWFFLSKISIASGSEWNHLWQYVHRGTRLLSRMPLIATMALSTMGHGLCLIPLLSGDSENWIFIQRDLEKIKGFASFLTLLMWKIAVKKGLWDTVAFVLLHPQRKVAPCDLVMKGCEHTAHCQTNPNTVIEILILLSPSISVTANILHTCSYFKKE